MKKRWVIINRLLVYGFFATGVILLFYSTGRISTILTAFGSFIASVIIAWILNLRKIDMKYMLYINILLWTNMIGEIILYYQFITWYDKVIHYIWGIVLTGAIYQYYQNINQPKKDLIFFTFMGMIAIWEIYEFIQDGVFGTRLQGIIRENIFIQSPISDTIFDLIWNALGSLSYLFFKKEKVDISIKKEATKTKELIKKDIAKAKDFIREKRINREPHYFKRAMKAMWGFRI